MISKDFEDLYKNKYKITKLTAAKGIWEKNNEHREAVLTRSMKCMVCGDSAGHPSSVLV